jgi:hypothetical protein
MLWSSRSSDSVDSESVNIQETKRISISPWIDRDAASQKILA